MPIDRHLISLGVSLALGLLVGLQRERANSAVAGFRTFALITMLGTLCAMLAESFASAGVWLLAGGLIAIAGATAVGNFMRVRTEDASPGITTEVAALLMFLIGASLWTHPMQVGAVLGVIVALLLHLKDRMHAFAGRLSERDMHAIMQFCAVAFVVLPLLPNRTFDPLGVLNPRHIWWMVVLVVSISLAGYLALKLAGARAGLVLGGLIGGVVSSTATTASYSRRASERPDAAPAALLAVLLAQCVLFARVLVEIGVVAEDQARWLAAPVLILAAVSILTTLGVYFWAHRSLSALPEPGNPTELKSALWFGLMYAIVLVCVAASERFLGDKGVLAIACVSGLTDLDAITLSTSRLVAQQELSTATAWRAVVLAILSNTLFKLGLMRALGGPRMFRLALWPTLAVFGTGVLVLVLFPADLGLRAMW